MSHDSVAEVEITVFPANKFALCPAGVRLHEALAHMGIPLTTPCGGNGTCGKCVVRVASGHSQHERDEHGSAVQVCACQYVLRKSLVVWLPEEARPPDAMQILTAHQSLVSHDEAAVPLTPESLAADGSTSEQKVLTCDVGQYVVAIDIGTTTIVAELMCVSKKPIPGMKTYQGNYLAWSLGLRSCHNPQAGFGDDVISRIQYASESPGNRERLRMVVVDAINSLIPALVHDSTISQEEITLIAIAGNTTMQQLFTGLDVQSLGHSPFEPVTKHYSPAPAHRYGININPFGLVVLFPVIGGFVGGDIVAGLIATQLCSQNVPSLLIDIGTNGEIVLWQPEGDLLLAAATAAGPAFEGARISQGMIAAQGAIERVVIGDGLLVETIGNQPARGICGSGLIDLVAELVRVGAIASSGQLLTGTQLSKTVPTVIHDRFVTVDNRPAFMVVPQYESGIDRPILLTQYDIRQVQLAAGAIRAGVTLLLRQAGLKSADLANVFLAGGFGNYIRRENAQRIGLLPPEIPVERIQFCGNTSLAGAKAVLLSTTCHNAARASADKAQCIDLSKSPDFSTVFAESMFFPTHCDTRVRFPTG